MHIATKNIVPAVRNPNFFGERAGYPCYGTDIIMRNETVLLVFGLETIYQVVYQMPYTETVHGQGC